MRQIYAITLFLLPFWCFSQLSVKPYKNMDSYIYVENQLLFVEKEIKLISNPSEAYKASIYLRDEAQLIQGNSNSINIGNGALSVFQEGKATAYTYNYWGSPVEVMSLDEVFGNILYEPISKTNSKKVQVTQNYNGHAKPLTISKHWTYKLSGQGYTDWEYIGDKFDLAPGEGFTMKGVEGTNLETVLYGVANNPGNSQRYDFRGRPNSGNISLNIKAGEIKLVGNPYPSALDLNAFLNDNQNTTGIAYFWDSSPVNSHFLQDYVGGYGAYSPALGNNGYVPAAFDKYDNEGIPAEQLGTSGNYYSRRYSPIAQGFVVEGLKDGQILFQNKHRVFHKEDPETSQFKSPDVSEETDRYDNIPVIRFRVEFDNHFVRELLLAFHPDSTNGIDWAMDAVNLSPAITDGGWNIQNEIFQINILPESADAQIPLLLTASSTTHFGIKIIKSENFLNDTYLWDSENDVFYNIKEQEVNLQLPEGEFPNRFFITFRTNFNETPNGLSENINLFGILQNNHEQQTEIISPLGVIIKSILIYDSTGRKIKEIKGVPRKNYYEISTAHLSKGFYIIKILTTENTIVSKKVIISN